VSDLDRKAARANAARSLFKAAGVEIVETSDYSWVVGDGYVFSSATGFWRHPDGTAGGGGPSMLIAAHRKRTWSIETEKALGADDD
jgi:hypothetical protein